MRRIPLPCILGIALLCGRGAAGAGAPPAAAAAPGTRAWAGCTWRWEGPRLGLTYARGAGGRYLLDEDQGWWRSTAGEVSLETGVRIRRGGLQAVIRWRGAVGEHLPARGRLRAAYLGWHNHHWSLRVGRLPVHWGPAGGALLISRQAQALDQVSVETRGWVLPGVGGWLSGGSFLGYLDDRYRVVPFPLLWGMQLRYQPCDWLSIGARRTILFGGAGRTSRLSPRLLWQIFWGQGEGSSAATPGPESFSVRESDQKFAWLAALHPEAWAREHLGLEDLEILYTYAGEDRFQGVAPMAPGRVFGLRLHPGPRLALAGLRASTVIERNIWYRHKVFLSGYTYRQLSLGHPMGPDARMWRVGLYGLPADDLLLSLEIDREERGMEKPAWIVPGGFWRCRLTSTTALGAHRLRVTLGAAAPWGADRDGERSAESIVGVELHWGAGALPRVISREVVWGVASESR